MVNRILLKIENVSDTRLEDIFENGQCFRWKALENDGKRNISYIGIYNERVYIIKEVEDSGLKDKQDEERITLDVCIYLKKSEDKNEKVEREILYEYLDLNRDYSKIKKDILEKTKDTVGALEVKEAISYGKGIRILKQDILETTISFIISANNNIPKIKKSVEYISKNYGEKIEIDEEIFGIDLKDFKENMYTIPKIDKLINITEEGFKNAGTGFRAKRLVDTIGKIKEGFLESTENLSDEELYEKLIQLDGVGPKVANCIMLFGYNRLDSFPIDVWVKRVMHEVFFKGEEEKDVTNDRIMNIVKDIKNYTLRMFGMEEKTLKEEENPIASNLGNDARRLAVNKYSGKIVENKSEPISIDTNNSGVQTPAAGNINIGKQKEEPIKIPVNNNTKSENLVVNNMYYSQLNDYGKIIYDKLRNESKYFLDGEHVFDYGTIFDRTFTIRSGKRNFRKVISSGS